MDCNNADRQPKGKTMTTSFSHTFGNGDTLNVTRDGHTLGFDFNGSPNSPTTNAKITTLYFAFDRAPAGLGCVFNGTHGIPTDRAAVLKAMFSEALEARANLPETAHDKDLREYEENRAATNAAMTCNGASH